MPESAPFVWYEFMTPDPAASQKFYAHVAAWTVSTEGPDSDYWMFSAGGTAVAGLMTMPALAAANGAPIGWRGYIGVPDTDAALTGVQKAGGALHYGPETLDGIGRFASITDPQGAPFLLFTPAPGSLATRLPPMTPGAIGWHELHAADWRAALDFYTTQFGWTATDAVDMGPMGTYQMFMAGKEGGGMLTRMDASVPPHWLYYIVVDGIEAAKQRVLEAGGTVVNGPHQVPGGSWILQGLDTQGSLFALVGTA
jgi:predicted enzyme related to lactoylglutathione lyase